MQDLTEEELDATLAERFAKPHGVFSTDIESSEAMWADLRLEELAVEPGLTAAMAAVRAAQILVELFDARLGASTEPATKPPVAKSLPQVNAPKPPSAPTAPPALAMPTGISLELVRRLGELVGLRVMSKGRLTEFRVQRDDMGRIQTLSGPAFDMRLVRDDLGAVQRMTVVPARAAALN